MEDKKAKNVSDEMSEKVQAEIDELEIKKVLQTKLYSGRHMSAILLNNGNLFIHQKSHQSATSPTILNLTPETFSFMLEVFLHLEKEFKIDRKKNINKLSEN